MMKRLLALPILLLAALAHGQAIAPIPTGNILCNSSGVVNFPAACASLPTGFGVVGVPLGGTGAATLTGPLKGNGTAAIGPALAADIYGLWSGTCSASTFLRGDGSCQTPAGSGSVTSVSVVTANGFAGTVATATTTPAITLTTSITGPLKGAASALQPAVAADIYGLWTGTCSASTFLRGDGSCQTPAGAGTINSGTSGQVAYYASTGTAISGATLGANLVINAGVLGTSQAINPQTATSYAVVSGDAGKLLTFTNAASIAVSLSQATTAGFTAGFSFDVENLGAGAVTITPTTSTINGLTTLVILQNQSCTVSSDGANYQVSACDAVMGNNLTQAAATSVDGITLIDPTAATVGAQQFSPRIRLTGQGWKTAATAGSQQVDWIMETKPVQGTTSPTASLVFSDQVNGGGYTPALTLSGNTAVQKSLMAGTWQVSGNLQLLTGIQGSSGYILTSATAPIIASGFGTSPSISANNGVASFAINVGTGGTATSGVITLTAAGHGWSCYASDVGATPTGRTEPTAMTTTSVTLTNYDRTNGAALAWTASEIIQVSCFAN